MPENISCFEMKNFRALNFFTSYLNISKTIRVLIQITLCRNARIQMDLSKNNCFSAEEAKNYIPHTEKRKKVPVYEMLEFSWSSSSSMVPILSWKLKLHTEAALRFLTLSIRNDFHCHKELHHRWSGNPISAFIFCLFSVQNITKNNKTLRSQYLHDQSQKEGH